MEDERELEGSIVSMKRGNARGERGPAVCSGSNNMGGKGDMTKTPSSLQDLSKSLYDKAKAEPTSVSGVVRPRLQEGDTSGSL